MQAYAEGFDIFKNAVSEQLPEDYRYDLNVADIAELWRRGSVVSSWLLDLTSIALAAGPEARGATRGSSRTRARAGGRCRRRWRRRCRPRC